MSELERLIAGSYGSVDNVFAGHANDAERARASIVEAGKQNVGLSEFLNMHREYMLNKGCSEAHILEQIENVQDISSYFDYD